MGAAGASGSWQLERKLNSRVIRCANSVISRWSRLRGAGRKHLPGEFRLVSEENAKQPNEMLSLENELMHSDAFRHLHLELASGGAGLQVLHCVMLPYSERLIPICCFDLAAFGDSVSLAVADACPVDSHDPLPHPIRDTMINAQARLLPSLSRRSLPSWGERIFSDLYVCLQPGSWAEAELFLDYVDVLVDAHVNKAERISPLESVEKVEEVHAAQMRFCNEQLRNDKTRRQLEISYGREFADQYMTELMFDVKESTPRRLWQKQE